MTSRFVERFQLISPLRSTRTKKAGPPLSSWLLLVVSRFLDVGKEGVLTWLVDRVTHWQDTIGSVCGTPGCPAGTCDILHGQWNGWYTTYTSVDVSAYAAEVSSSFCCMIVRADG